MFVSVCFVVFIGCHSVITNKEHYLGNEKALTYFPVFLLSGCWPFFADVVVLVLDLPFPLFFVAFLSGCFGSSDG